MLYQAMVQEITFTISGSGYESSSIAFIGNDGTSYSADTVTVDSSVQITCYSKIKFTC